MKDLNSCYRSEINETLIKSARKDIKSNKAVFDNQTKVFLLLGNDVRLKIVYLLFKYDKLCVCDFSDILEMNQSPISQHLRKLKDAAVLENQREGTAIYYFVSNSMKDILKYLLEV